ncbi:MAG: sigma-70 family RNA polymerase sigma factor, partial [bacterium]|nr:sigma-70 family RNA polymerase sigma factor [bacterium]
SAKNEKDRLDREKIESVLLRLKEEERTLLLMKYKEGFSNSEIAQILEMPENRINVKLFRAKEKLREYFETENRKR